MKAEYLNLTLADITEYFREKYPKAVNVTLEISNHTSQLSVRNIVCNDGSFTTKSLDGEWVEKL